MEIRDIRKYLITITVIYCLFIAVCTVNAEDFGAISNVSTSNQELSSSSETFVPASEAFAVYEERTSNSQAVVQDSESALNKLVDSNLHLDHQTAMTTINYNADMGGDQKAITAFQQILSDDFDVTCKNEAAQGLVNFGTASSIDALMTVLDRGGLSKDTFNAISSALASRDIQLNDEAVVSGYGVSIIPRTLPGRYTFTIDGEKYVYGKMKNDWTNPDNTAAVVNAGTPVFLKCDNDASRLSIPSLPIQQTPNLVNSNVGVVILYDGSDGYGFMKATPYTDLFNRPANYHKDVFSAVDLL